MCYCIHMVGIVVIIHRLSVVIVVLLLTASVALAQTAIHIPAENDSIIRYDSFLAERGKHPLDITDLTSEYTNRIVADLIIIQQALQLGGFPVSIHLLEVPNSARERMMVRNGEVVMSGQDLFSMAITDDVYKSTAVIPKGGFVKGIYGRKGNELLRTVDSLEDLRQFKAVSSKAWMVDWMTLQKIGVKKLRSVPRGDMMPGLVDDGKVDFALLEFTANEDLSINIGGHVLYPVPGVKIGLVDSRHFTVSKRHPYGASVYEALEKGLAVLLENGTVDKYYTQVGFYNEAVADWKLLNP